MQSGSIGASCLILVLRWKVSLNKDTPTERLVSS